MDLQTTINVAAIIQAAQSNARVAFVDSTRDDTFIVYGTARRISGDTDNVLHASLDITTDQGYERSLNVGVCAQAYAVGEFAINP